MPLPWGSSIVHPVPGLRAQQTQDKWDFQLMWEEGRELGGKWSKALSFPSLSCAPPE